MMQKSLNAPLLRYKKTILVLCKVAKMLINIYESYTAVHKGTYIGGCTAFRLLKNIFTVNIWSKYILKYKSWKIMKNKNNKLITLLNLYNV